MKLRAEPGTLLCASPDMLDPNFMHTVVLIAQHTDEGAYGLVINRPAGITVGQIFSDDPRLGGFSLPVHWGGPVSLDTLQYVHRVPEAIPGGMEVGQGLHLGGDLEALLRYLDGQREAAQRHVRLLLGYAGWGKLQLDDELATGSWMPAPLVSELVFEDDQQATWRRAIRLLGEGGQGLADQPPDLSWN